MQQRTCGQRCTATGAPMATSSMGRQVGQWRVPLPRQVTDGGYKRGSRQTQCQQRIWAHGEGAQCMRCAAACMTARGSSSCMAVAAPAAACTSCPTCPVAMLCAMQGCRRRRSRQLGAGPALTMRQEAARMHARAVSRKGQWQPAGRSARTHSGGVAAGAQRARGSVLVGVHGADACMHACWSGFGREGGGLAA